MNKTFFLRKEDRKPRWRIIDAKGKVVGRLATQIADILRGKDLPTYTPHTDSGDYVVVINVKDIVLTGNKVEAKEYNTYSGYIGGLKTLTAKQLLQRDPARILFHAVKGMLAHTKMSRAQLTKLKIYPGAEHPHQGQAEGLKRETVKKVV
ncbi:MAG TPA: 50S ribosomal protein L13 [Candidatus Babeliaceae bacterium]|nr:50S ribosomal protein L13 [Candidatus Babeliaceae bacterium]